MISAKPKIAAHRPPHQREKTVRLIRQRILSGEWQPGDRLPTRRDLTDVLDASLVTVDAAMQQLARDGFVEARGSAGTYVADYPPHLCRFGLVFFDLGPHKSLFFDALRTAAKGVTSRSLRTQIVTYDNINGHRDDKSLRKLIRDLRHDRLAGLIYSSLPGPLTKTFATLAPQVPQVLIASNPMGHLPSIYPDVTAWFDQALAHIATTPARRVGMLALPDLDDHPWFRNQLTQGCQTHGLQTQPWWTQYSEQDSARSAYHAVSVLMHLPVDQRPEALLIADNHLVPAATKALAEMPEDDRPVVVAHCNTPAMPEAHIPVTWLGVDVAELFDTCMSIVDRRLGTPTTGPQHVTIQPRFVNERN